MPSLTLGEAANTSVQADQLISLTGTGLVIVTYNDGVDQVEEIRLSQSVNTIGPFGEAESVTMFLARGGPVAYDTLDQSAPDTGTGGSAAAVVPYSSVVSFTRPTVTDDIFVSGPIAFTANLTGALPGPVQRYRLLANGTNVPTFASNMYEVTGSSTYVNTLNQLNIISFEYDGTDVLYSISNIVGGRVIAPPPAPDVTAPLVTARAVANASPTIVAATFGEAMNQSITPAASAFSVTGHTVSSVAWSSSTVLNLTVTPAFVNGEAARTLAYTTPGVNGLRDVAGNLVANFTGQAIVNNVAAEPPAGVVPQTFAVRSANFLDSTPSGTFVGDSDTASFDAYGVVAGSIPANQNGWIAALFPNSTDANCLMCLDETAGLATYNTQTFVASIAMTVPTIQAGQNTASTANIASPVPLSPSATLAYRICRTGTTVTIDESPSGYGESAVWTTRHTFPGSSTAELFGRFYLASSSRKLHSPVAFGFVV